MINTGNSTGLSNADSYISVGAATAYHASLGNSVWAALASDELREQALRRATQHLTQVYCSRWRGVRTTLTQALDWPRYKVPVPDVDYGRYIALCAVQRGAGGSA